MKSITMLHNQHQAHQKANGNDTGSGGVGNDKKLTRRDTKSDIKKAADQILSPKEKELESVQQRIGMIIHEIRNPLTAISLANQSLSEEIHDDKLPSSFNTYTDIVAKNINRIEALLRDLLFINCSGNIALEPTDLCELIEQCLAKADDRIFLKKLRVERSYSAGIIVNGNAEKLAIVFLNIIINSVEAVKESEGNLFITVYQLKNEVRVIFKDNGCGMDPEVAHHMFDRNFSSKRRGLGVGMSHVKEILALHNASIAVNSEPGTGTTIMLAFKRL